MHHKPKYTFIYVIRPALILLICFLLHQASAYCQDSKSIIKRIDSLAALGLPKSALVETEKLDELSRKQKDLVLRVKAVIYRNQFLAADKEAGAVTAVARLQKDIAGASFPLKPVLHSILGGIYLKKYQETRGSLYRNPDLPHPGTDISKWSARNFFSEINKQFGLALKDALKAQDTPMGILDGVLEGDSSTRYLRPTLYDLLLARALEFYLLDDGYIMQPKIPFDLTDPVLFSDSKSFARLQLTATDTTTNMYQAFRLLQQATAFHLKKNNADAVAQLDLKRLMYLYRHQRPFTQHDLYIKALTAIADKPNLRSAADALTLLGSYYKDKKDLVKAVAYYEQVVKNYPNGLAAQNCSGYMEGIKRKYAKLETENPNVPGKALLASVYYTNVKRLHFSYYKLNEQEYDVFKLLPPRDPFSRPGQKPIDAKYRYISSLKNMREQTIDLPDPKDYQAHTTEFKIDPLEKGMYVILMKDADSEDDQIEPHYCSLQITSINYLDRQLPNGKISMVVADRQTGKPTANAKVITDGGKNYKTDKNGMATLDVNHQKYTVKIFTPGDSLILVNRSIYGSRQDATEVPVINTIIYPDREVYRPGQTIYFSGLHVQTVGNKDTVLANTALSVRIMHNYDQVIGTIPVTTNEFGTFHGSFVIPMNTAGNVAIGIGQYRRRDVRVEEYKRPTFRVEFDPITKSYFPNDSVTLSGTVRAYAGFGISNAKVAISNTRELAEIGYEVNYAYGNKLVDPMRFSHKDTLYTDAQGRFIYRFKADAVTSYPGRQIRSIYKVDAVVVDGNNATQKAATRVVTAKKNVALLAEQIPNTLYAERDSLRFKIWLTDQSGLPIKGNISATMYSLKKPAEAAKRRLWYDEPDVYLMDSATYQKYFPSYMYRMPHWPSDRPLDWRIGNTTSVADGRNVTSMDLGMLKVQHTGAYCIILKGEAANGDTVTSRYDITWYDKPDIPVDVNWCAAVPVKDINSPTRRYFVGNGKRAHVFIEVFDGPNLISAKWRNLPAGKQQEIFLPLRQNGKELSHQFTMFWDNRAEHLYIPAAARQREKLDMKLTTFRDKLQPGEKEQWKLQIRAKDNKIVPAQMVATMYDATLDALDRGYGRWWANLLPETQRPEYFKWERDGQDRTASAYVHSSTGGFYGITRNYERIKLLGYRKAAEQMYPANFPEHLKEKRPGYYGMFNDPTENLREDNFDIYWDPALRELNVMHERISTGDYVTRRELSTPPGELFKKDALVYSAIEVTLRNITPRTNFNETAFFYPELRTDKDGLINIDFTMPQSLTQWRFKAFAHTKDLVTGYIEQNIVTQKQLSVSAGMPRFFRTGDTITVAARVANLTSTKLEGHVLMQFFNGLTDQPINIFAEPKAAEQPFGLDSESNRSLNFKLIIPEGLEALKYRISAASGDFTDAEENTLPVLSKQVLVTTSLPMMVRPGGRKSFTMDALAAKHSPTLKSRTLTLEYTTNTAWSAIQALPTLTDAADDSPEQLFGRYFANGLAAHLISKQPAIKQIFDRWRSAGSSALLSNLEKNKELKTALLEASPWLHDARTETGQKQRLALLFDVNQMGYDRQNTLNKLATKQLADGGFAWFGGNVADSYITRYILAGIGQLNKAGVTDEANKQALKTITDKAIKYSDTLLVRDIKDKRKAVDGVSPDELYAWYARSYFAAITMGSEQKIILAERLKLAERQWLGKSKYEQGLIAMIMLRNGKPEVAQKIVRSLTEAAQTSADMGMYWVDNRPGYYWYQAPIETHCLLIELFSEIGGHDKAAEEMKLWLISNKQANSWRATKATAAACFALLINGTTPLNTQTDTKITIGGAELTTLKPDVKVEAGTGYLKTTWTDGQIKPAMAKVDINNLGKSVGLGALHWQYLDDADKVKPSQSGLQLDRKYFIVTKDGSVAVDAKHQPKPGDLLKVVLYVKADRDMDYIHLKDNRPAGTEPVDVLSAYKYQGGLYYYMVTRDLSTNFYISRLTKGSHVFEYEVRAAQPGNYSAGVSTVQSMYAPEFNATVGSQRLNVAAK